MNWPSVLAVLLVSFEVCAASSASSPVKKKSTSVASSPIKLDLSALRNLNDFTFNFGRSPMKVIDTDTKYLALNFDDLSKDSSFSSKIFYPKSESIYIDESWKVPLHKVEDMKNLMNLESKFIDIRASLKEELIDHAASLSWVSDGSRIVNYILVVSTSISQLSYLISRLSFTTCQPKTIKKIRLLVSDHLKVLADFCDDLLSYSGRVGMTFDSGILQEPTKYFENLFVLRDQKDLGINDKMFQLFIDFFFDAFASEFKEKVIEVYLDYVGSGHWAPLPINYLRDRMLLENPEEFARFVAGWRLKAFGCANFDTRNLVNLGYLLQQGMLNQNSFLSFVDILKDCFHQSQFKFDKDMVTFLTLFASTPWLLPADRDAAMLIGNFASSVLEFPTMNENEKIELIEFIWKFFVGSADFAKIRKEEYENLCKLIQKLDFAFPGISDLLWAHVNAIEGDETNFVKGNDAYEMMKLKIKVYNEEIKCLNDKAEYLKLNFSNGKTVENDLVDTKALMLLFEFFTDVLVNSVDAIVDGEAGGNLGEHQRILGSCIDFFDVFLAKFAHKSVIDYWYKKFDFIPTKLFDALNELWILSNDGSDFTRLTSSGSLIWENVTKLVDNNLYFARAFMMILKSKTLKHKKPAFSAEIITPKCLLSNGEADGINLEYFRAILNVSENEIADEFFIDLSDNLAHEEISFASVEILFKELLETDLNLKISSYSEFWNPSLMIYLSKFADDYDRKIAIRSLFKIYLKLNKQKILTENLLINCSNLIGFNQFIRGEINENCCDSNYEFEMISEQASPEELQNVAKIMFVAFNRLIIHGVTLSQAHTIFTNLIAAAKIISNNNIENSAGFGDFVHGFNALLLAIIRIPEFVIPEEENSALILQEFYRKCREFIPNYNTNLKEVLRQSKSVVAIYGNLIKNCEALPVSAFDLACLNDKKIVSKIQKNYIAMIGEKAEHMTASKLNPIAYWIRKGQIDSATFIKLLKHIKSDQLRAVVNCLPLIAEFIKSERFSIKSRVEALETAFSEDNDELIRSLANRRLTVMHANFIELFARGPQEVIDAFLDTCTDSDWHEGLKIEMDRFRRQKSFNEDKKSANISSRDEGYLIDLLNVINSPLPDYMARRQIVQDSDEFISKISDILPILRDGLTNRPLEYCVFHLISANLQISDGIAFFKIYAKPETFLGLLRMQVLLFKGSPKRKSALIWLLDSIRVVETRMAVTKMLPYLITSDSFVLTSNALKLLKTWFGSPFDMEKFLIVMVTHVFKSIFDNLSIERAAVLDEMFSAVSEGLSMKIEAISSSSKVHLSILDGLIDLKGHRRDLIEKSNYLMEYLKNLIEAFSYETELMMKIMEILKEFPSFYLKNKINWIVIWKRLNQLLPFKFMGGSVLNVYYTLGSLKFTEWKPVLHLIPSANLPSKILVSLVVEIAKQAKTPEIEILNLLPEKLEIEDFSSFDELETVLKFILKCLEFFEIEEAEISSDLYRKLFLLLDFEWKVGMTRIWTWRRILNLAKSDSEKEDIVFDCLLDDFPELLKKTCTKQEAVLMFLFELNKFISKFTTKFDETVRKAVEIYDEMSGTVSNVFEDIKSQAFNVLEANLASLNSSENSLKLDLSLATMKEFKYVLGVVDCKERNDRYAMNSLAYILTIANKAFPVYLSGADAEKDLLSEYSDIVIELIHEIVKSGNLVSLARVIDALNLETLISSISYHLKEKTAEFIFIINEMMKFAPIDVADLFFIQISQSDFRVDICFFNREIIEKFHLVTGEGYGVIGDDFWPALYLNGLIKSDLNLKIDLEHFYQFETLLEQIDVEIDFENILQKLGKLLLRPNVPTNVLDLVERLYETYGKDFTLELLYEEFLIDSVVKNLLKSTDNLRFVRFLKDFQKKNTETFSKWTLKLESKTQKLLTKALQSDAENAKINLHTALATNMIQRLGKEEFVEVEQVENLLKGFKNLDIKVVEISVMISLGNVFVDRIQNLNDGKWRETVENCVKFLLNFRSFESETFDKLMRIVFNVFSEDLLTILVEKAENHEGLKTLLNTFAGKIDFSHMKSIKSRLKRFNLFEVEGILISTAKNSEPSQAIELFPSLKNLTTEKKLELLENCRIVKESEKVGKLIIFYKNLMKSEETKTIALKSLLRNHSILSCFMNQSGKNDLKNKSAVLEMLKNNLKRNEILKLADELDLDNVKIIVNLYFKASSTNDPIIPTGSVMNLEVLKNLFSCFLAEIKIDSNFKNKAPMYLKAFKFYDEIEGRLSKEELLEIVIFPETVLNSLIEGLAVSIESGVFVSSPQTVYSVYKLTRRIASKKKERYIIMRKMLFSSNFVRAECIEAFIKAQIDSGNIDWEFHEEMVKKTRRNQRAQTALLQFENDRR